MPNLSNRPAPQPDDRTPPSFRRRWVERVLLTAGLLLTLSVVAGCSMHRYDKPRTGTSQRGIASWYGEPFHGRKTASGEVYDMHGMTAAHRELPLGTTIEVTNLENGRQVRLRVNDRGPFIKGRVLDVSYAAAQKLGMVGPGTARIELTVVQIGEGPSGASLTTRFTVQVGAFSDRRNAEALHRELKADYADAELIQDGRWHRVRVGRLRTEKDAEQLATALQRRGLPAVVVRLN